MRVFKTYDEFILDDPGRLVGPQSDFGWWTTIQHDRASRLSWIASTGDLYMYNAMTSVVVCLANIQSLQEVKQILNGWEDAIQTPESGVWLQHRLKKFNTT